MIKHVFHTEGDEEISDQFYHLKFIHPQFSSKSQENSYLSEGFSIGRFLYMEVLLKVNNVGEFLKIVNSFLPASDQLLLCHYINNN